MDAETYIEAVAALVPEDDDVYTGPDGLLHCNRCGGKRQTAITVCGKKMIVPVVCQCMDEAHRQERARRAELERKAKIDEYRSMGFSDPKLKSWTFATDDGSTPKLTRAMKTFTENFEKFHKDGKGLFLYGNVGTGKTFYAACIVNALIDKGYPCLMTNFARIVNKVNERWETKQMYIDRLSRFSLIAIDDLGVERNTEFMNEAVTTVIDSLYRANVSMIITSNNAPAELTQDCEMSKRRVYDRLLEKCHPIKIDGASRRKNRGRQEYHDMNKLLGLE